MREMVLNHASVTACDEQSLSSWLHDVIIGMNTLINASLVPMQLRAAKEFYEIQCTPGTTLDQVAYSMFKSPSYKDSAQFLMVLSSQVSVLKDSDPAVNSMISGCELRPGPGMPTTREDGKPLLYCAITDGVAVGIPSDPVWESGCIDVDFNELTPDGDGISQATETIDNLTRSEHARPIVRRHQANLLTDVRNFDELWDRRESVFPNLAFGPDVERQLRRIDSSALSAVVKKLTMVDKVSQVWRATDATMPDWGGKVTPESDRVRSNPTLIQARRFRSSHGTTVIFDWHARFGNAGRIHLRFDAQSKEVEIGYIGRHLPL